MLYYSKELLLKFIKSPTVYILLLLPILYILGLGWLFPSGVIIPSAISIAIAIPIIFYFGGELMKIKKSMMIKSISLTKITKVNILTSNFISAFVVGSFFMLVVLFVSWFLDTQLNFLADDLSYFSTNPVIEFFKIGVDWDGIAWWTFIYGVILSIALSIVIMMLFLSFTKNIITFYLLSFFYLFCLLILGGVIIPTILTNGSDRFIAENFRYLIPHNYTNQLLTGAMSLETVIASYNIDFEALYEDIDAIYAWYDFYGEDILNIGSDAYNGLTFNFTSVPGYENYEFQSNFFTNAEGILVLTISRFDSYLQFEQFMNRLETTIYTLENLEDFSLGIAIWDWDNWESMLNSFLPVFLIFGGARVIKKEFKWSVRG